MSKRSQLAWRVLLACTGGLFMSGLCLHVGLPKVANWIQEHQSSTRHRIERLSDALDSYRIVHHAYPQSLSQVVSDSSDLANDAWNYPLTYTKQENSFLLTSYGADRKPGGTGLNCDLTNRNLFPSQAQLSTREILKDRLSGGLKGGVFYSGLLTFFLIFRSLDIRQKENSSRPIFCLKSLLTLVAAFFVSLFITIADIPLVGH